MSGCAAAAPEVLLDLTKQFGFLSSSPNGPIGEQGKAGSAYPSHRLAKGGHLDNAARAIPSHEAVSMGPSLATRGGLRPLADCVESAARPAAVLVRSWGVRSATPSPGTPYRHLRCSVPHLTLTRARWMSFRENSHREVSSLIDAR